MKRVITIALAALALAGGVAVGGQQVTRRFVPVTDAMLQKPEPFGWLSWRRTLDGWGYSPLDADQSQQRRAAADGVGPRAGGARQPGRDADRP